MRLERIISTEHSMYTQALDLYKISFPVHEQRETLSQNRTLQDDSYHFDIVYDEEIFVGVILYWETSDYVYIEHFCILPEMRNRQYGKKTLALLGEKKKLTILEIDPPIDETSRRRKRFYERCGFIENPYPHIHPPYHKGNKGHELVIMSSPGSVSEEIYHQFSDYLQNRIMHEAFLSKTLKI